MFSSKLYEANEIKLKFIVLCAYRQKWGIERSRKRNQAESSGKKEKERLPLVVRLLAEMRDWEIEKEKSSGKKEKERLPLVIPCILSYIKLVLIVEQTKKLCVYHQLLIFLKLQLMFNRLRAKGVLLDFWRILILYDRCVVDRLSML